MLEEIFAGLDVGPFLLGAVVVTGLLETLKDGLRKAVKVPSWIWPWTLIVVGLLAGVAYSPEAGLWHGLAFAALARIFREVIVELPKALVHRVRGEEGE